MPANVQSMFSGRNIVPWHKLGTIVEGTPTSAEAIKLAGLDWTIEKRQVFARIIKDKLPDGSYARMFMKRVDSLYATVRSDNDKPLGIVGKKYTPFNNVDAFEVLDEIGYQYETAGALGEGETVFMLLVSPEGITIAGDAIRPYFLATTSHDGTSRIRIRNVATRVVCANTLAAAMGERVAHEIAVTHTASAKDRMKDAARILKGTKEAQAAFVATADQLLAQPFTRANFETLVARIMPPPDPANPLTTDRQCKSWQDRFEAVMRSYGAPDLENVRATAWGAFNAIADYEQHDLRTKGTETERLETLFRRSFLTPTLAKDAFALITAGN